MPRISSGLLLVEACDVAGERLALLGVLDLASTAVGAGEDDLSRGVDPDGDVASIEDLGQLAEWRRVVRDERCDGREDGGSSSGMRPL